MKMVKGIVMGLLLLLGLAACSSDNSNSSGAEKGSYQLANNNAVAVTDQYGSSLAMSSGERAAAAESAEAPRAPSADYDTATAATSSNTSSLVTGSLGTEAGFNRQIIYTANLSMQVEHYGEAQSAIRDLVQVSGGYIMQFEEMNTDYEKSGTISVKVPSGGFTSFLDQLQQMKTLSFQKSVKGQDVTEEYVDVQARLKAKEVVETRLLSFMEKATTSKDLLEFSNQLAYVQEEIERLKGRIRYLDQNVAYSTVSIRVSERLDGKIMKQEEDPSFLTRVGDAVESSLDFLSAFFQGVVIFVAGALPILIVLGLIAIPFLVWLRKYVRAKKEDGLKEDGLKEDRPLPAADAQASEGERKE